MCTGQGIEQVIYMRSIRNKHDIRQGTLKCCCRISFQPQSSIVSLWSCSIWPCLLVLVTTMRNDTECGFDYYHRKDKAGSEPTNYSRLSCCKYSSCIPSECITAEALPILSGVQAIPVCISVKLSSILQQARRHWEEGQVCMVQQGVQAAIGGCHQHRLLCLETTPPPSAFALRVLNPFDNRQACSVSVD